MSLLKVSLSVINNKLIEIYYVILYQKLGQAACEFFEFLFMNAWKQIYYYMLNLKENHYSKHLPKQLFSLATLQTAPPSELS